MLGNGVSKFRLIVIAGFVVALIGAFALIVRMKTRSSTTEPAHPAVRYEAEDGLPKDEAGERRRDFAVLEAALNDLADPSDSEHRDVEARRRRPIEQVVINHKTSVEGHFVVMMVVPGNDKRCTYGHEIPDIPLDLQKDLERRGHLGAISLVEFKPANPKVIVHNLDEIVAESTSVVDSGSFAIRKKLPKASRYLWAHPPGYSTDGNSAVLVFGFPQGMHSGDWVYVLRKKGKRWAVDWRHCRMYS
jgi:hypothetical protein